MEMTRQSQLADEEGTEAIKGHATRSGTMSPVPARLTPRSPCLNLMNKELSEWLTQWRVGARLREELVPNFTKSEGEDLAKP